MTLLSLIERKEWLLLDFKLYGAGIAAICELLHSALFGRFRGRSERHRLQLSDLEGGGGMRPAAVGGDKPRGRVIGC
jgi:hypothetical protein